MKNPTTHIVSLLIILFIFSGCGSNSQQTSKNTNDSRISDRKEVKQTPGETPKQPEIVIVDPCGNTSFDLMENINKSVVKLEGTPYSRELKNDCSGIFHQVLDGMRADCPDAIIPTIDQARSSRNIAVWYASHGELKIIRDPSSEGDLIQPGKVLFYGHASHASSYNYKTMTIDTLAKQGTGINHVAIVTDVTRDENGVLQSYVIFHGRNEGKPASKTTSRRTYDRHSELPVYGNWGEPWLAIADPILAKE